MVAHIPAEQTPHHFEPMPAVHKNAGSRQYDSFTVRLWHDENSNDMLRVEVQHVQAGFSFEALQVPLDWIVPEILGCLRAQG